MTDNGKKIFTFISRRMPYGSEGSQVCLDLVLACSVYDRQVNYLFLGDGVYQLLKSQQSAGIDSKNLAASLTALEVYGVEKVFADGDSLRSRNLDTEDLVVPVEVIDADQLRSLIRTSDAVFNL
jgi:tRNA 2-thiouridine synthesizing protein C